MTFLIIDNYDSFVHNLARYFELAGVECIIERNNEITSADIAQLNPQAIILSPGPCTPKEAGICIESIKTFGAFTPILGVCLGQQCIGEAFGAPIMKTAPVHGRASMITHERKDLFCGLPSPLHVGRYHSLINDFSRSENLIVSAQTADKIPMAIRHKRHPVFGVQFHPESILTDHGLQIIQNFVRIASTHKPQKAAA